MRLLLAFLGGVLVHEAYERVTDWRWEREFRRLMATEDEMDAVQQSDPWPPDVLHNVSASSLYPDILDDWLEGVRVHSRFSGGPH